MTVTVTVYKEGGKKEKKATALLTTRQKQRMTNNGDARLPRFAAYVVP